MTRKELTMIGAAGLRLTGFLLLAGGAVAASHPPPALAGPAAPVRHAAAARPAAQPAESTIVVYLVRHAEKLDESRDPPLNDSGRDRARVLAHLLGQAGITWVWSTDFRRTRETAKPLADRLNLETALYNPVAGGDFVARLRRMPGVHLVVGHSNTVPELVRALGGEPGPAIVDSEYDRLYVLVIEGDRVTTLPLRFGTESR